MAGNEAQGSTTPDPIIGRSVLGHYRVDRKLGAGGMGAVYLLRHQLLPNTFAALKVLLGDGDADARMTERFQQEAMVAAAVGSHRVAKPIEIGRFDDGTQANRKSILNTFRTTWKYGLDLPVKDVSSAQLDTWLARHRARIKRTSLNAYIVFLRQVFNLAISARALAESPAAGLKVLKPEEPIRDTPTWPQFREIVEGIRRQKLNDDAGESAGGDVGVMAEVPSRVKNGWIEV